MDILIRFPGLFAFGGVLIGGILTALAAIVFFRKYGALMARETDKLVEIHDKQLHAQAGLLEMQKSHYEAELAEVKASAEKQLAEMKAEKENYKDISHALRNDLGAQITELKIDNEHLKARPDVSQISEDQKTFYSEMLVTMRDIASTLDTHDKKVDERMKEFLEPVQESAQKTCTMVDTLMDKIQNGWPAH